MPWVLHVSPEVEAISKYPIILGVCLAFTSLTVLIVAIRFWVRKFLVKHVGSDVTWRYSHV